MTRYAQGGHTGPTLPAVASAMRTTVRLARYAEAKAHRARLIDSGEYVKTSEQTLYVFKWADPILRTRQAMADSIFDMITAMNLSQCISAPVKADQIRARRAGHMRPRTPRSPDCRDGNCRKCDGQAWDDTTDALASCTCACHLEPTH